MQPVFVQDGGCDGCDGSDGSEASYFEHGAASGGVGNTLFAAIQGSAAVSQDKPQRRRSLADLLQEVASALSQDASVASALSQDALSQGDERPRKVARRSVLLTLQHEVGVRYGIAKAVALASKQRNWATEWALKTYPDMCRTKKAREKFLKNARRWCKNQRRGAYGRRDGVSVEVADLAASSPGAGGFELSHRSGQGSGSVRVKFSRRRRGAGAGGPGIMKMACVGEELFCWFVDTLNNVKGRLPSALLLQKAQMIAKDLVGIHQESVEAGIVPPNVPLKMPAITYSWLRRWRRTWGGVSSHGELAVQGTQTCHEPSLAGVLVQHDSRSDFACIARA